MAKPKIALFKFSSCARCLLSVLNLEDPLLTIAEAVNISYFVMAKRDNQGGPYDISFIEGAVTTQPRPEE